jgi:predicted transcriptional regulator
VSSEEKRNSEQKLPGEQQPKLDLYVIARIIIVLKEKGATNRTNLATFTGLAYDKLAKYLAWMNDKKLISSSDEAIISLTEEGIKSYEELVEWIMRYIGRVRFPKIS